MTPKETLNQQIWAILQDIEEDYQINTRKEGDVKCILPDFKRAKNICSPDRIGNILRFLEKEGAFKIRGLTNKRRNAKYLIINPTRFEEIYEEYRQKNALIELRERTFDWGTIHQENLELPRKVIEIILNYFEIQPFNRFTLTNRIPLSKFEAEHIHLDEVSGVLNKIDGAKVTNHELLRLVNERKRMRQQGFNSVIEPHLPSEEELKSYVFLQISSLDGLRRAKKIIDEKLKRGNVDKEHGNVEKISAIQEPEAQTPDIKPFCETDREWGLLKFSKYRPGIKIGKASAQPFKLLQCLTTPFGRAKTVDIAFEAIREGVKHKSKSGVYTTAIDKPQKIKIIEYTIKELQKGNKLQHKLVFKWDNLKTKVWLEYLGQSNSE